MADAHGLAKKRRQRLFVDVGRRPELNMPHPPAVSFEEFSRVF
jgi:hypothetical protein